ncbi:MAG TPA: hypothetical protein VGR90_08835 [Acidimicrobiales bacterium]|nr:hypothetical protein [Acidimicrobiales bacterium]
MQIRFAQSARRHRVGKGSVRYVMATVIPTSVQTPAGNPAWFYLGSDERGRELEIVAVELGAGQSAGLLVIHVMPTQLRGS